MSLTTPRRLSSFALAAGVLVCFALAADVSHASPLPVHRVALVIGANDGGNNREVLRYAESDAEKFEAVLTEIGRVLPQELVRLRQPTPSAIAAAFRQVEASLVAARKSGSHTEAILYYSGHSDEEGLLLGADHLTYPLLRQHVAALSADVRVVVLDSCASGAITRSKGGTHRPPFLVDDLRRAKGHAFLTSSAADEVTQESDRLQGSFFTHALVTGLRGAADLGGDGRVTLHEAYQFAYHSTLLQTERTLLGPQHAAYEISLKGTGDVVITDLAAADAQLQLASSLDGRISIRDVRGHLAASFDKAPGREEVLALPVGRYVVSLRNDAAILEANVNVQTRAARLTPFDFVALDAEISTARGAVRGLTVPFAASSDVDTNIGKVIAEAKRREALLRYQNERIEVREEGDNVSLFLGDSQVPISGADFYGRIGRNDLADAFIANSNTHSSLTLGGIALELAGVFVAGGALAAAALIGTGPIAGIAFVAMAVTATAIALSGAGLASVSLFGDPNPVTARENAALARDYNRSLRQKLRLHTFSDDEVKDAASGLSSPPLE